MKKTCSTILITIAALVLTPLNVYAREPDSDMHKMGVYLGINYFADESGDVKDDFKYRFLIKGRMRTFTIDNPDGKYPIQNKLMEGYTYALTRKGSLIKDAKLICGDEYEPNLPVKAVPGVRTLKNFLATALGPVGNCLYVYGGGWNWQDEASSNMAMTIGTSRSWNDFFNSKDSSYDYMEYYSRGFNRFFYDGLDCSGYVGWTIYNMMNSENATVSEDPGYVMSATKMASTFAEKGFGVYDPGERNADGSRTFNGHEFKPGDIVSMDKHVWICLGSCDDGSMVILHSTPNSTDGAGVQISAIGNPRDCEAYRLADYYMNTYYPLWSERYGCKILLLGFDAYTRASNDYGGILSWDLGGVISDPDGFSEKTADVILRELYNN